MSILKNKNGYRIGWKVLLAFFLYIAGAMISMVSAVVIYNIGNFTSGTMTEMINVTMESNGGNALCSVFNIIILWCMYLFLIKKNKVSLEGLGLSGNIVRIFQQTCVGFLGGALMICIEIGLLYILGYASISPYTHGIDAAIIVLCGMVTFLGVAFTEEITFRGYIQGQFGEKKLVGIIVTALLFAAAHLMNSNYTFYSLIYLLIGGIAFSLMRTVTNGIWFPVAFHLAWDWVEISFFGLNEEGTKHWLTVTSEELPYILICSLLMLAVTIILIFVYRKQKE